MPCLDHILLLVPISTLANPPPFLTENFTITPGGAHTDNITQNTLIIFGDGVYIEVIAFAPHSSGRQGHRWGSKVEDSIIDFAFTSHDAKENYSEVIARLEEKGSEVRYDKPVEGGRKRPDGVDVKWEVTFLSLPDGTAYQRGTLPFFCHDVTPRELRVPRADVNVFHPSGAQGVKSLTIYVAEGLIQELKKAYCAVLGVEEKEEGGFEVPSLYGGGRTTIYVKVPKDEELKSEVEMRGGLVLGELVLWGESVGERKRLDVENGGVGAIYLESR